jgi:flagellar motor switch protein FliM
MKLEVYDFRKPGRLTSDLEQRLASWLRSALALLPAKWAKHLPLPVTISLAEIQTAGPNEALALLPDAVVCHCLGLGDAPVHSLLAFPRNVSLALLAGVMGDSPTEFPQDRVLTPVEDSLWNFLLQQLLQVLEESWPSDEPMPLAVKSAVAQPKRCKILPSDTTVLVLVFVIGGPFGESKWFWLVPQQDLMERLTRSSQDVEKRPTVRPTLESLVGEMAVEFSVRLGATELPVSQLTRLRAGDVVILDQRVSEPLEACIAGQTRFHVWPGRVGPRRAFQIDSLVDC